MRSAAKKRSARARKSWRRTYVRTRGAHDLRTTQARVLLFALERARGGTILPVPYWSVVRFR